MTSPAWRRRLRRGAGLLLTVATLTLGSWSWPVEGAILRAYEAPATRYSAGHRGIDIAADAGSEVSAPAEGVVHFAGWVVDRPVVSIDHGGGLLSSYEPVSTELVAGDAVTRADVIGLVVESEASHCAESCLHLGVRVDGDYINPLLFLGGLPWSVLYPSSG